MSFSDQIFLQTELVVAFLDILTHLVSMWPPAVAEGWKSGLCSTWGAASLHWGCTFFAQPSDRLAEEAQQPTLPSVIPTESESVYTTHFHFASTWRLLFFSRASCFLSYQVLFMLKLGKTYLHSRNALPS